MVFHKRLGVFSCMQDQVDRGLHFQQVCLSQRQLDLIYSHGFWYSSEDPPTTAELLCSPAGHLTGKLKKSKTITFLSV